MISNKDKPEYYDFLERLAVPSWVIPGTIAQNANFLSGKVPEIAICCFECASCLAYTGLDLPFWLAELPFTWHVHLPVDLPWEDSGEKAVERCLLLREKLLFLRPRFFILHPPLTPRSGLTLEKFADIWHREHGERLLLENTETVSLADSEFLSQSLYGFCLDVAHALSSQDGELLASDFPEKAEIVHWSAPCGRDAHKSLVFLSDEDLIVCKGLAKRLRPDVTHVLEIFDWPQIMSSLPVLSSILAQDKACAFG